MKKFYFHLDAIKAQTDGKLVDIHSSGEANTANISYL